MPFLLYEDPEVIFFLSYILLLTIITINNILIEKKDYNLSFIE